ASTSTATTWNGADRIVAIAPLTSCTTICWVSFWSTVAICVSRKTEADSDCVIGFSSVVMPSDTMPVTSISCWIANRTVAMLVVVAELSEVNASPKMPYQFAKSLNKTGSDDCVDENALSSTQILHQSTPAELSPVPRAFQLSGVSA